MCGIIGYCGKKNAEPFLLEGLCMLEYRGYDSVGIACYDEDNKEHPFHVIKEVGKVSDLKRICNESPALGHTGIGHCRWATHGGVNYEHAHPHVSSDGEVVLVHNGIIENYLELREFLLSKGFSFNSQGDSETIANLLAFFIQGHAEAEFNGGCNDTTLVGNEQHTIYQRAMISLKKWLRGSYALTVIFKNCPQEIYALRHESPLVVGRGKNEAWLASDIIPLAGHVDEILYLENHELVQVSCHEEVDILLFHEDGSRKKATLQKFENSFETIDKQGYEHFMLKEIFEQPLIFSKTYSNYINAEGLPLNFDFNQSQITILENINRIIFVSCGTSYHASIYASYIFEQYAKIQSSVEYASEFRYRNPIVDNHTLIIALSQSGETADTLAAVHLAQEQHARTLAVVNVDTSSIARTVDIMLCTDCGPEIGVASTKAFTTQMLLLYYLCLYLAHIRGSMSPQAIIELVLPTKKLPQLAEKILSKKDIIKNLGKAYAGYPHILYLGRGLFYPIALEGALKLKEISYIHAEGYAAAEMKHGPIALIDHTMPVLVCAPKSDMLYEKVQSNISEVKARGGRLLVLISEGDTNTNEYDDYLEVPTLSSSLDPILFSLPLQLFAYYTAIIKGFDPDQPRNLAKSVTVE